MGAHCSIHNDTPNETVMVFVGVNTKVIQPLLLGITGAATIWSGGVALGTVPATTTLLGGTATATATGATVVGDAALPPFAGTAFFWQATVSIIAHARSKKVKLFFINQR